MQQQWVMEILLRRSFLALNRFTTATNQASASMGLGTTADNFGMLAVGVNNAAGLGYIVDPTIITIMLMDSIQARIQVLRLSLETETLILQMEEQGTIHPMHLL